jgi:hypothetical protein
MDSAVTQVDYFLWMSKREAAIGRLTDVPAVGRTRRVASLQCVRHCAVLDRPGKAAIPNRLELAIPVQERHPYFDLDF